MTLSIAVRIAIGLLTMAVPIFAQPQPRPITIQEGLRLALAHNENLLIAQEDFEKSRQQVREAAADAFPQLTANASYTRNWLLPTFVFGNQQITVGARHNMSGSLGIRQSLYSGGKVFSALKIARMFRTFSQEGVRLARQRVCAEVEIAYYDWLMAHEFVRVTRTSLERARANQHLVAKLREAGRVSDYDLLRAQVQVAELQPDSIQAASALTLAALSLKNLIGIDAQTPIEPRDTFHHTLKNLPVDDGAELVAIAHAKRPEMRQTELEIAMRKRAETISQSSSRPSLNLLVNFNWEAQRDSFGFDTGDFTQSRFAGLNLSLPLFDGFRTGAQVSQARIDTRRAELQHRQVGRAIRLEVMQTWQQYEEARARLQAQHMALDLARRGLRITESRYENGVGTQLEVIDGQLALRRAEAELARVQHDLAVARVYLERSIGILHDELAFE